MHVASRQVLPNYMPLHTIRKRRRVESDAQRAANQPQASLKMRFTNNAGIMSRIDLGTDTTTRPTIVRWLANSIVDEKLAERLPAIEREYRKRAERWTNFENEVVAAQALPSYLGPP